MNNTEWKSVCIPKNCHTSIAQLIAERLVKIDVDYSFVAKGAYYTFCVHPYEYDVLVAVVKQANYYNDTVFDV